MRCLELEAKFVVDVEADVLAKLLVDIYYHFEMWCSIFFLFFYFLASQCRVAVYDELMTHGISSSRFMLYRLLLIFKPIIERINIMLIFIVHTKFLSCNFGILYYYHQVV